METSEIDPNADSDRGLIVATGYGITGCGIFKAGIQNWKGFCIKINCSQMKLLNFESWTDREPQLQKSEFLKLIIYIFHIKKKE